MKDFKNHYHNLETGQPTKMRFTPTNPNYEGEQLTENDKINAIAELHLNGTLNEQDFLTQIENVKKGII